MEKYDLIIVGAGPAGIFTAVELLRHGSKKKILLVEKGKPVEKRHCPKAELGHCVNCRPTCAITTGFSGAGAFSDGKLSLSYEVGTPIVPTPAPTVSAKPPAKTALPHPIRTSTIVPIISAMYFFIVINIVFVYFPKISNSD